MTLVRANTGALLSSYSRLIVATVFFFVEQSSGVMQGVWSLASGIYRIKVFIPIFSRFTLSSYYLALILTMMLTTQIHPPIHNLLLKK